MVMLKWKEEEEMEEEEEEEEVEEDGEEDAAADSLAQPLRDATLLRPLITRLTARFSRSLILLRSSTCQFRVQDLGFKVLMLKVWGVGCRV